MKLTRLKLLGIGTLTMLLAGCLSTVNYRNSSVVDFLYPKENEPLEVPRVPTLTLPLRVGVAFTPTLAYSQGPQTLTEKDKSELMAAVSERFKAYDFVEAIEIIPSAYLRQGGSFDNLNSLKRMFRIDVIALLSYDQTRFTDEGLASLAYWTLLGAYVVPGEKNDTHTLLDAAVYDIASRSMLFRAPGVSMVKSKATPIGLSEQLRKDSVAGFNEASLDLAANLDAQLTQFRERVKQAPDEIKIAKKAGYTGAGAADLSFLFVVLAGLIYARRLVQSRRKQSRRKA